MPNSPKFLPDNIPSCVLKTHVGLQDVKTAEKVMDRFELAGLLLSHPKIQLSSEAYRRCLQLQS